MDSQISSSPPASTFICTANEVRVLGSLLEKEFSTPDVYPLTFNSLTNACNQKNNRAPVVSLGAHEVESALEGLRQKRLVSLFAGADARVPKFKQSIDAVFPLEPVARALFTELLLRGPQTSSELRTRSERLTTMPGSDEVEAILVSLADRPALPLVRRLSRQPGQKEARWGHLLSHDVEVSPVASEIGRSFPVDAPISANLETRVAQLEIEVAELRSLLTALRTELGIK